jgi:uncharacterized protein involved in exopolysaccharide biosynthesis
MAVAIMALLLIISVFPRDYTGRVKIMPPQSTQAGLGALLSQLGGLASIATLVGGRQPTEVYLLLARSNDVSEDVLRRLAPAAKSVDGSSLPTTTLELSRMTDVHSLRGGVIEVEAVAPQPELAKAVTTAYVAAFQDRLAFLARDEIGRKKSLMAEKLRNASEQLARAEAAMTQFRTSRRIASAEGQLSASVGLLAALRAKLQAKEVEIEIARQFVTPQNYTERRIEAEINGLRKQIAEAESAGGKADPFGFQSFTSESSDYVRLYRDLKYAEALYEVYARFSESINVEEMSSSLNAQVVESPFVDPGIKPRAWAMGLAGLVLLLALYLEFYSRHRTPGAAVRDPSD